jgi:hypothetical protein
LRDHVSHSRTARARSSVSRGTGAVRTSSQPSPAASAVALLIAARRIVDRVPGEISSASRRAALGECTTAACPSSACRPETLGFSFARYTATDVIDRPAVEGSRLSSPQR